ncbi:hypothetical protein LBMAG44_17470 [Gemmatimonadota bacterium]|nr:hypothetical protein LBMAG44_17470 [Gemmatimonadota bacterium]
MTNKPVFLAVLLGAIALSACGDNAVQVITKPAPSARVKFFNFGVNAPGVNFYANAAKITAVSSTTGIESTTGTIYGGVGSGGYYAGIDPGQYTFTGKIAAAVDKDLTVSTVTSTIASGKAYSVFLSGFYDAAGKTVEGFVVEDPLPAMDYNVAYVRFVNAISNSNAMTLYAKNTTTLAEVPLGAAVAYKGAGAFVSVPVAVYDLGARVAGASANTISRTAVSFVAGRVYTVGARGDITITSTTATNRSFLDNTANR